MKHIFFNIYFWMMRLRLRRLLLMGSGVKLKGVPIVSRTKGSKISIGEHTVLVSRSQFTALGVPHPVILRTLGEDAEITIGNHCGISGAAVCSARSVNIGSGVLIGSGVQIFDTDFHSLNSDNRRYNNRTTEINSSPVVIEDNVFIGTRAIICKGVTIGEGSVVAAGAVVVKSVPSRSVAAGNPAKVVSSL